MFCLPSWYGPKVSNIFEPLMSFDSALWFEKKKKKLTKQRWPHTNHSTAWVTWPYAAFVWCCANTCQPTQPTFSEPPRTRTMKGLLQTPPSGKLGLDWFLRGIEVYIQSELTCKDSGWYQGVICHESCFCWCCLLWCTYRTFTRSTHIWKYRNMHHWIVCRDTSGSKRERYPERSKTKTSAGISCKESWHELIWTTILSQKILA